jgi:hypothetical protein
LKRNEPFILSLFASVLWIGCHQNQSQPPGEPPTSQSNGPTNASPPNGPQFCYGNDCEETARYHRSPLNSNEANSLSQALKQTTAGQNHVEATAVNGSLQFHVAPGAAPVTPNTAQIAVSNGTQVVKVPLSPEADELARRRTTSGSH